MENAIQMLPCRKRTFSSTHDEGLSFGEPQSKIAAKIKWYVLESESSLDSCTDDGTESVHSIQDKETDCVRDTTDTDSSCEESLSSDADIAVEFEVASSSDESKTALWTAADSDSSSGTDDILTAGVVAAICSRSSDSDDDAVPADTEGESQGENGGQSGSDSKLSKPGRCIQCKGPINTDPLYRYCERCYQVRKTFFPPRPRAYRSRNKLLKSASHRSLSANSGPEVFSGSQESGLGSSQETFGTDMIDLKNDDLPSSKDDQHPTNFIKNSTRDDASADLCIVCTSSPKNGIFVHGSIGHMCCCYRCAVKVWTRTRRCPACNCKSKNVLKAFLI